MNWQIVGLILAFLFGFYMATRVKNIERLMKRIIKEIKVLNKSTRRKK